MFSLPKVSIPSFLRVRGGSYPKVELPTVQIHDIETAAEKRPRTLKHLLKANHANYSIIYHDLRFHNHTPHILGSAFILGGTAEHLNDIYEKEAEQLEPWKDAPGEISREDWREFLGKREYQRAFVDFFEDQLVLKRYNIQDLLDEYLLGGKEPLINGLISGLAHPLIHLGYGYELESNTVAIEALALGACFYSPLHKYIDDPKYTKPSLHRGNGDVTSLRELLDKVREDKRFDGLYEHGSGDISKVLEEREEAFLEYWNGWEITRPTEQFQEAQQIAAAILVATPPPAKGRYDFFFVHILTSSHAIRILLPLVPAKFHINLLRQWWLFALAVYIAQTRPRLDSSSIIEEYDVKGREWKHVVHNALDGPHSKDAHYVKALRSLKVCAETWGDENKYYRNAAIKFADEFEQWGGFGTEEDAANLAYPVKQ
ncbi:hypothetical protein FB567DRAFT_565001 [Paraphoma chrysanthemicola]|uniref:MGS207 protein n=1 Tax=Paraphoma chrysanthemicola TaxID=798071 RepID=A0A8K0QS27_9PLEO|nr:hypothetical protein FB567DRAFT_565001 [Paraphoma chrysanthemicola]